MGHDGVASGYLTPTDFRRLTGCQRNPQDKGVTPMNLGLNLSFFPNLMTFFQGETF